MNDGDVVVKMDGKFLDKMEAIARGDAAPTTEAAPVTPTVSAKPPGEPGVRRTTKYLPCVLTERERVELHGEIARDIADADDAEREIERIKEDAKADVAAATSRSKAKRVSLADKARTVREGKLHRDVAVTVRIDWHARTKTTSRDDTSEVLDVEPATMLEVNDCGTWETDLPAGKSFLKAPDGAVLDQRNLTDSERQAKLPLADGGEAPVEPAKADRAWMSEATWDDLDEVVQERMVRPDPKGPALRWTADGPWMFSDLPVGLRPQLEHHATQAEIALAFGPDAPTLASLAAASKEPAGKPRRKANGRAGKPF